MSVRAKFVCQTNNRSEGQAEITLSPVTDGSEENKSFFKYTPGGQINLSVVNDSASRQFEVGKHYYVDFTPAD